MKIRLISIVLLALCAKATVFAQTASPATVSSLSTEHAANPIGIGQRQPRLSWKLVSDRTGEAQTAYKVRAAVSKEALAAGGALLWDSGKVATDQSVLVPWGGSPLGSRAQVFWQVRAWDKDGQPTAWSAPASFELGLIDPPNDWKGRWITAELPRYDINEASLTKAYWINAGSDATQPAAARKVIELPAGAVVKRAYMDLNGDGLVTLYVNGNAHRQGGSSHTAPMRAEFGHQLAPGRNVIAIGALPVRNTRGGPRNAIVARGVIELEDGTVIAFDTDATWKTFIPPAPAGPRRGGPPAETAPATPDANWFEPSYNDSAWPAATLVAAYRESPPVSSADSTIGPGRYLRKTFDVKGPVARARLYSTALGTYEAQINGQPVSDHQLDPGWTDYYKRVMVQTSDVTALLRPGRNVVGALLTDGWFAGRVGWMGLYQYSRLGRVPQFAAQLEITYADGSQEIISTDNTWKGGGGAVAGADQQMGEVIDARAATAWEDPAFDDSAWNPTIPAQFDFQPPLVPQLGPPVRALVELKPKSIRRMGGNWIVDFGQNMVGHVRLKARGPSGAAIHVRHGEMLNADGSLYTENLRPAISLDTFILRGAGRPETFEPRFTFHGFRYAEVSGYPGELTAEGIQGIVVGSDTPASGSFESSNADLNQLFSNIVWGQRGNFLSVPTDCPQRDERMGWLGDAQVFAPTSARNADVSGFFAKWLTDVNDSQTETGVFPRVAPAANQLGGYGVWGDAGCLIPWAMYNVYGDKEFLAASYPYMTRWVNYLAGVANNNIVATGSVGDHLSVRPTPTTIMDTAFYANSARIVSKAAAVLGRAEDAAAYEKLFQDIAASFTATFVAPDGAITAVGGRGRGRGPATADPAAPPPRTGNTQTAFVLALHFDLVPDNLRPVIAQRLIDDVQTTGSMTTGFVGSGLICPMLTKIGRPDLAWKLVFNDQYPSWLFSVRNGATTIWERWDSWTPERGLQTSTMNSFNHYSFGAVGEWFYSGAAGIQMDEQHPGYKRFFLRPQFTDKLTNLKVAYESPYGQILSHWRVENGRVIYDVVVPPNSSALLSLPVDAASVRLNGQALGGDAAKNPQLTDYPLAAGKYQFSFPANRIASAPATATVAVAQ